MFRGKLRAHLVALLVALIAAPLMTHGAARADDSTAERREAQKIVEMQRAFLDPQAEQTELTKAVAPPVTARDSRGVSAANAALAKAGTVSSATGGKWAYAQPLPADFSAIHVVVGRSKILLVAGSGNDPDSFGAGTFQSFVCATDMTGCRKVDTPVDLFCAGHVMLPDGRALVGGGTISYKPWKGAKFLYAFNFETETYEELTPLEVGRWYPSMITTTNGSTLITGGFDEKGALTKTTELFDYRTNSQQLLADRHLFPLYPRIQLTKRLDYFFSGVGFGGQTGHSAAGFWNPVKRTFKSVSGLRTPKQRSSAASCFVGDLRNQDLLVLGGGSPAVSTTDKIKLSSTTPRFTAGPKMKAAKQYVSCLTLPDGTLLEAGGGTANKISAASTEVGLLKSIGSQWTTMNPIPSGNHRLYHSVHFLLDDGRVASLGSNPSGQPRSPSLLLYSPPYLYKGTRPEITNIPTSIKRYSTISVDTTGGATRLTFTKPPTPTHGMDPNDGYMSFPIVNGKVDLSKGWARYLPRGYYRVWAVNAKGAVSEAKWTYMCDPDQAGETGTDCHCC